MLREDDVFMIDEIPKIPEELKNAAINGNLVVFIGAGVSKQVGCKDWSELASNLINKCHDAENDLGHKCVNFREKKSLLEETDYKKVITICHKILRNNDKEELFFNELEESLNFKISDDRNIYDELRDLDAIYITTNVDNHFDNKFDKKNVFNDEEIIPSNIRKGTLFHIHGSLEKQESMVFTVQKYIQRYNNKDFTNFLDEIFNEYHVLFIGYGMNEFELIDYLIKNVEIKSKDEIKHFILLPFFAHEENLLELYSYYYKEMQIKVVGYAYDDKGYSQLYKILQDWNSKLYFDSKEKIDDWFK